MTAWAAGPIPAARDAFRNKPEQIMRNPEIRTGLFPVAGAGFCSSPCRSAIMSSVESCGHGRMSLH